MREAEKYGYTAEDVCADALVMTVSANPEAADVSLRFIEMCAANHINTVCGLSNVSFGLPQRSLLNQTFLCMAMGRGLNMAIANPLSEEIMNMTMAADVLSNKSGGMKQYIGRFSGASSAPVPAAGNTKKSLSPDEELYQAVLNGDTDGIVKKIDAVLSSGKKADSVINEIMIPAITEVGSKYEKKEFYLPQLIMSAEAMQKGTGYLENMLEDKSQSDAKKIKMILATVKGDIHDIGKNIIAVMFRNYGFHVIDLGKDVPAEVILDTAVKENVSLIGLSALMTTTMNSMRDVVELARKRGMNHVKFLVGGAVVDQHFADEIGAYYAADPMSAVHLARKIMEN